MMGEKKCYKCGETKETTEFCKRKKSKDGLIKLCCYTNLQPLGAYDNRVKGDKII